MLQASETRLAATFMGISYHASYRITLRIPVYARCVRYVVQLHLSDAIHIR